MNLQRRALEGLTPELSRAEGVGLNDWLGLMHRTLGELLGALNTNAVCLIDGERIIL